MPDGYGTLNRETDPFAWIGAQIAALKTMPAGDDAFDRKGLLAFLEDSADAMIATVNSRLVNLMTHLAKAAVAPNAEVAGHWRSECLTFHGDLVDHHRPSMRRRIDRERLWTRARKRVAASFADHGQPAPTLPETCPFTLEELVDEGLDVEGVLGKIINHEHPSSGENQALRTPE